MNFVEVVIASSRSVLNKALTYSVDEKVAIGQVVRVPVANKQLNGIVIKPVKKPSFATKPVTKILDFTVPKASIELAREIASYYVAPLSTCMALMIPNGVQIKRRQIETADKQPGTMQMQPLTKDQTKALVELTSAPKSQTCILQGRTGTGKTRVYLELAKIARQAGLGSIILTPEIGLTTQLLNEVQTIFDDVFVMHSKMSLAERHLQWLAISRSASPIVLGPRSALFSPIKNLGLVVIDESHEHSYKQDQTPKYNALRVARMLCDKTGAKLVLGSATPQIEDVYVAKLKSSPIIPMRQLATGTEHQVSAEIVDLSAVENRGRIITDKLAQQIEQTLSKKLQVLIFHNRRGSSTSVICENCGYVEACPNCAIPLVHHHDKATLRCHVCGFSKQVKMQCLECKQASLRFQGFGTKQIEQKLVDMFPLARIARFDSDSPSSGSLAKRYKELRSAGLDIIVGTQMIGKGLDLPNLETIGVVNADSLMYLPDFSSTERFFQLLYQVIGRVGRHREGKVIIQTYNTKNPILKTAIDRDFDSFYEIETAERKEHGYPPFVFLMSLTTTKKKEATAINSAEKLASQLTKEFKDIVVLGPAPAFHAQSRQGYRWQLVIKSKDRSKLQSIAKQLPSGWQFDIDPYNLLG